MDLLGFLQFLGSLDGICFVLSSPLSHLRVGLGHGPLQFSLGLLLLLILLPEQVAVVAGRLHCVGQGRLCLSKQNHMSNTVKHFL